MNAIYTAPSMGKSIFVNTVSTVRPLLGKLHSKRTSKDAVSILLPGSANKQTTHTNCQCTLFIPLCNLHETERTVVTRCGNNTDSMRVSTAQHCNDNYPPHTRLYTYFMVYVGGS